MGILRKLFGTAADRDDSRPLSEAQPAQLTGFAKLALGEFEPQFGASALNALAATVQIPIIEYGLPPWTSKIRNAEELQRWGVAVARASREASDERGIYILLSTTELFLSKIADVRQFESWMSSLSSVYKSLPMAVAREVVGYAIPMMENSIQRPEDVLKKDLWREGLRKANGPMAQEGPNWRGKRIPSEDTIAKVLEAIKGK